MDLAFAVRRADLNLYYELLENSNKEGDGRNLFQIEHYIMQQKLVDFLSGSGIDDCGRTIKEIIRWPDGQLEKCHDYIQWAFPNRHKSHFNPGAPILDNDTIRHLLDCPTAISNIQRLLTRLFFFYSFEIVTFEDGTYQLELSQDSQKPWWITPRNHNYLRLTRILKTLKELQLQEDLNALSDILDLLARKYHHFIGEKTLSFWRDAGDFG